MALVATRIGPAKMHLIGHLAVGVGVGPRTGDRCLDELPARATLVRWVSAKQGARVRMCQRGEQRVVPRARSARGVAAQNEDPLHVPDGKGSRKAR